ARRCRSRRPSGEDLVDEELRSLALRRALLVVARDHLADQAEREELHPDDDEQDPEREQRPLADRVARRLHDREVDEDRDSREPEQEAETAEEVERALPVPADERDGQEVEEAAQVALDAVARAAMLPRPVVDAELRDAEAAVVRKHGDEAVQLSVDAEPVDDLRAVGLQAAVHVVEADAREAA